MSCLIGLAEWRLAVSGIEALQLAAGVGADGVQFDLGGPGRGEWIDTPGRINALRAEADSSGVRLLALAGNHLNDVGLTSEPAVVRPIVIRLLDAAHALGVPLAFIPSFRRSTIDGPAAFIRTAKALRWAAREAEARGLVLASENVLAGPAALALAEQVGSPAFRLVLDTLNPVGAGLSPRALVRDVGPLLADQVHLKDGPPDVGETPLLGKGAADLDSTLDALRESRVFVRALVLENDYRIGGSERLTVDVAWARDRALRLPMTRG